MMLRDDAQWLVSRDAVDLNPESLTEPARLLLQTLERERALFFGDLLRLTRLSPGEVEDSLWELVAAGLVTADGFENIRALIDPKRRRGDSRLRQSRPRHAAGRWALVPREASCAGAAEKWAEQLMKRWGVLMRDLLAQESGNPPWRDLLPVLRRMEAQGQIRGGRFIAGFTGEQFAKPEAIDLLRAVRRESASPEIIDVTASDPLHLAGIILPGPRVSRLAASYQPVAAG
jgi:ATP-dependent Lhr-like helicase